jgi:hypothetical protein
MLASAQDEICEAATNAAAIIWKIVEPIEVVFPKFFDCHIRVWPTNPDDPAGLERPKHLGKMKGQTPIRKMFNHMMRVKCIDGFRPKRQLSPDIRPNIDLGSQKICVNIRPIIKIITLSGPELDPSWSFLHWKQTMAQSIHPHWII